jgi:preprotein translocase SecF subunit
VQSAVESGGVSGAIVQQTHGQKNGWQIQTKSLTGAQTVALEKTLSSKLGVNSNDITVTTVGPSWGSQISGKALEALIAFLIVIVIYLSIAFELRMAIAAFVALLHDLVIATGIYALAGFQVSPATVIGLLTILGYSLYDTVVVFDKVRENTAGLLGGARTTYSQAANLALNQTLVRSINTSLIALLPVRHLLLDLHRDPGAGRPEGAPAAVPGAGQAGGGARLRRPGGQEGYGQGGSGGSWPARRHGCRVVVRAACRGRTGRHRLHRRDRRVRSDGGRADHHRVARPGRTGQSRRAGERPARPAAAAAPRRQQCVPAPPGRQEEAALADDLISRGR